MTGLDEFHKEVSSRGYKYMKPGLEETFHGTKAMGVIDPFGNRIHFNEDIKPADETA